MCHRQCFRKCHLRLFIILKDHRIYSFGPGRTGLLHRASSELISQQNMCYFLATKMLLVSGEVGKGGQGVFFERGGVSLGILSLELQYFFF